MSKSECTPSPTTSAVCFDEEGRLVSANGEFKHLESIADPSPAKAGVLGEYLSKFDTINCGKLGTEQSSIDKFIDRWAKPDGVALEAQLADGSWRMLTSCGDPAGGTQYLSVRIDEQKRQQSLVSFMMKNHPLPIWANETATGRVVYSNPAANQIYGNTPLSHENKKIADFLGSTDSSRAMLSELKQTGSINNYDVQTKNEAGEEIWVRGCARLAEFDGTEIVISSIQNITDRKRVEESSRRVLDLLSDAIESLSEGFALYDHEHRLVMFNERYREINTLIADLLEPGLPYEILLREMVNRGVYSDAAGREEAWVAERLENAVTYVRGDEVNHTSGKSYLVSIHPTKLGGFVVTKTDITARKQTEAQERDGDLLVRTVLDASSAVVVMARTGDGAILYRSPAAIEMFGNTKSAREHYLDPDERADFVTQMLADGRVDDYQVAINAKSSSLSASISARFAEYRGEEVIVTSVVDLTEQVKENELIKQVLEACPTAVRMSYADTGQILFSSPETIAFFGQVENARSNYVDDAERERLLNELRLTGSYYDRKVRLFDAQGNEFWGAVSARLIEFKGEEVIVSNARDLTDELALQEELETQREMIFQNEKMSALGELLAGVAHELNNPLSIVVGHSLMLREEKHDADTLRRIEKISAAAERSAKIVKTFLAMARQQPAKMEPVDVKSVVTTAIDVAGYGQKHDNLEITSDLTDGLPNILADADQITQVVINLVINAAHAINNSGTGNRIKVSANLSRKSDGVEITVTDNGPGIPENIKARIFEPFFTTKEVGDGTGIGLAFCHRIIHSHGGQIRLDPDYSSGSRFRITLPVATGAGVSTAERTVLPRDADVKRALIVDDEKDVAELITEILIRDGLQVDTVHSGAQALVQLEERSYDIVLSDLNMPELDGGGLFETLKKNFPDLAKRTAFITGDTMGSASQKLLRESKRPYLEKPVSPKELRNLVHKILNDAKETR